MFYEDRLETNLLAIRAPRKFRIISVIVFEVNLVDKQKQT